MKGFLLSSSFTALINPTFLFVIIASHSTDDCTYNVSTAAQHIAHSYDIKHTKWRVPKALQYCKMQIHLPAFIGHASC